MMRGLALGVMLALLPGLAPAQDRAQTLADIRAEIGALSAQFNALKQELVASGGINTGIAGGDALQRLDAIEAALSRLTAQTEQVQIKVNKVASDGTLRLGDLEIRVCELTEGCDIMNLPPTAPLGGDGGTATPTTPTETTSSGGPELAVAEKADFDRAKEVLASGDFRTAADLFQTYAQTYQGGPLSQEAHLLRGDALAQLGETGNAARAYLEAFSGTPNGALAGQALLKLGQSLGQLQQIPDACITLAEVGTRFPGTADATAAQGAMAQLGCQ
ncbi:tol-pal system protein YbgF [Gemmobacter tilapiae]|uniref:Cell division coordinator CpoB n=2 Tax=Neogemmobacter tilapiae TaxID=875041 RepID=A0A918TJQ8_9RHOB|nr:tol-pal system protein YbgF [Gemmobacter tilapiae]